MARQIKNFWLKIGTMFMTLYFMPLSHFIMSMFGRNASDANAATVYCGATGSPIKAECAGLSATKTLTTGQSVTCTCPDDTTKIQELYCEVTSYEDWDQNCSCVQSFSSFFIRKGACTTKNACSPNGTTQDCSTTSQYGTRTCTNGTWGSCVYGNCKSGYIKLGTVCKATCSIDNGTGYEYEEESSSSSSTDA